jgi:hypothetical protein
VRLPRATRTIVHAELGLSRWDRGVLIATALWPRAISVPAVTGSRPGDYPSESAVAVYNAGDGSNSNLAVRRTRAHA